MARKFLLIVAGILNGMAVPIIAQPPVGPSASDFSDDHPVDVSSAGKTSVAAVHPQVQSASWNVFLGQWRLFGPFREGEMNVESVVSTILEGAPKTQPSSTADASEPRESETGELDLGEEVAAPGQVIDFLDAFSLRGPNLPYRPPHPTVAFAKTRFVHDGGAAVLSLCHDDDLRIWLNGDELKVPSRRSSATIDQAKIPVELIAGVNSLVMRVAWRSGNWEAAARLTPPGTDTQPPPISLWFSNGYPGDTTRLPDLRLRLLSKDGEVIEEIQTSGLRDRNSAFTQYPAYLASEVDPDAPPHTLSIRWGGHGIKTMEKSIPWSDVTNKRKKFRLLSERPLRAHVVDASTGDPIPRAQFWKGAVRMNNTTGQDGRVSISHLNPLARFVHVAAEGYEAKRVELPWPFHEEIRVELDPGGKTLRGKVVTTEGKPIPGATIAPGLYTGYTPRFETDEKGEFTLFSIPGSKNSLSPVIEAAGYVIKDTFSQPLNSAGVTEVTWSLQKGTNVIGRVTDAETGKGLPGVVITSGESRFASNRKNPSTKSKADGSFVLMGVEPGEVYVHAFSDQYAPSMQTIQTKPNQPTPVEFRLTAGSDITGVVTDDKGEPIPRVWLITDTWNEARMFRRETHTDKEGRFVLRHMPESPVEVHVLLSGYVSKRDLNVVGGEKDLQISLRRIIRHQIAIRDPDGKPVPELRIDVGHQWSGGGTVSWRSGYEKQRFYDSKTGVLSISGGAQTTYKKMYRFRAHGFQSETIAGPESMDTAQSVEVKLRPEHMVSGKVTAPETGNLVSDVVVAIVDKNNPLRSDRYVNFRTPRQVLDYFTGFQVSTDERGEFQMPDRDDWSEINVVLIHPDGGFALLQNVGEYLRDSTFHFSLPASSQIEGFVLEGGVPVTGRTVKLTWFPPGQADAQSIAFGVGGKLETDAEGRFRFQGLGQGHYQVENIKEFQLGQNMTRSVVIGAREIDLDAGQTAKQDFITPAGQDLTGRVVDENGLPLKDVLVQIHPAEDQSAIVDAVRVGSRGRFSFTHVTQGDYRFSVVKVPNANDRIMRGMTSLKVTHPETHTVVEKRDSNAEQELVLETTRLND